MYQYSVIITVDTKNATIDLNYRIDIGAWLNNY